jgi:type IV pilus assembly protein PilO
MNRRTLAIGAATLVVISAAWFFLLWSPKGAELSKAKEARSAAQVETAAAKLKLAGLQSAAKNRGQLETTKARLVAAVPDHTDIGPLIRQINAAAVDSGIGFISVNPTAPVVSTTGGPSTIGLSIQLQGDYAPVQTFLDDVMKLERLVVIDGVALAPVGTTTGFSTLSLTVTAHTFTDALVAPVGAAAAPTTTTTAAGAKAQ